ncbi:MAG: hypothetical protein HOL85_12130 [Rhodospirillaceae bacterium]|jgi:hypothetical protein|nr:hypothetical protein [Rhodospirillaceae bacterium]MBT6136254.1 hypothetical protein [Rhodospirillaceae bacterium]
MKIDNNVVIRLLVLLCLVAGSSGPALAGGAKTSDIQAGHEHETSIPILAAETPKDPSNPGRQISIYSATFYQTTAIAALAGGVATIGVIGGSPTMAVTAAGAVMLIYWFLP